MAAVGAAAAVIGAGAAIYGQISAAGAEADAKKRNADFKRFQAQELLEREVLNEEAIASNASDLQLRYGASSAATGFSATGIGGMLKMAQNTNQFLSNARRDAEFKASMLRAGADIETNLASDIATASYITGAGTALLTAGQFANARYQPPSQTAKLPQVGQSPSSQLGIPSEGLLGGSYGSNPGGIGQQPSGSIL